MRPMLALAVAAMLLVLGLVACVTNSIGSPCARSSDCVSGFCSRAGYCDVEPTDAGPPDDPDNFGTPIPPADADIDAPDDQGP